VVDRKEGKSGEVERAKRPKKDIAGGKTMSQIPPLHVRREFENVR